MKRLVVVPILFVILFLTIRAGEDQCDEFGLHCSIHTKSSSNSRKNEIITITSKNVANIQNSLRLLVASIKPAPVLEQLSEAIQKAIGNVPPHLSGHLSNLSKIDIDLSSLLTTGMANAAAQMSLFITKSITVIERGEITNDDIDILKRYTSAVDHTFLANVANFSKEAQDSLQKIIDSLMASAQGGLLARLLKAAEEQLDVVVKKAKMVADSELQIGRQTGVVEVLKDENELATAALSDINNVRHELGERIKMLNNDLRKSDENVMNHRDKHEEQYQSFWLFSWKVRDIHVDNGQRLAEDIRTRTEERLKTAKQDLLNLNTVDWEKRKSDALGKLSSAEGEVNSLNVTLNQRLTEYNTAKKILSDTQNEIEQVFKQANSTDLESIKHVDSLCNDIRKSIGDLQKFIANVQFEAKRVATNFDLDLFKNMILSATRLLIHSAKQFEMGPNQIDMGEVEIFMNSAQPQITDQSTKTKNDL